MMKTFTSHTKTYFLLILFLALFYAFTATAGTPPVITSFSPASGPVGTSVTITGSGFNTTAASNIVFFGSTMAQVTAASATSLTVTVPTGASYQAISVLNGSTQLTGYSAKPFIVTFTGKYSITATDFAAQVNFTTAALPVNIAAGDLDGDGKPDLVVVNNTANTISIFRNTSTSGSITSTSFATKVDITTGATPYYVAIADLDGDGKPEIAVANNVGNSVSVFYNKSVSGTLTTASFSGKVDFAVGTAPRALAIGDIDGDGKADLVVTNTTSNNVSVLMNTTTTGSITASSFAAAVNFATGAGPRGLAIADLDGDGKLDLAIADFGASTISVLRNTSAPGSITASSFAATVDITCGLHPYVVAIGDIDGDGKPDMVAANQGASTMSVLRNIATSGAITTSSFAATVDIATQPTPTGVAIGDLDGDGKPDIVITNQGNTSVSVFRNTSTSGSITSSSLATRITYTVGSTPYNSVIQDIDGDGIPDIATVNSGANSISVLRNIPTPVTQATGVTFSATTATTTTVSWTNGSGVSRAVFILAGSTGTPAPVNLTTYTANAAYGSGTQIGTSSWYCIYNGSTGTSVNVTNLTAGTNYRVMVVEYNGTAGNELYQTATATNNPANLYNPVIGTSGSLSAMSTTYGTSSSSQTFSVSGTGMAGAIVVTQPTGFEVSTDNTTFTSTVTVGNSGTIASTPVYIRLAASAVAGTYSGNVVLSSTGGAASVNVITVTSTVSRATLTITATNQTKAYGAAVPSLTLSYSGFVNGDTQTGLTTQPTISTTATATSSVSGSPYAVTASGAASPNYTITYVAGTLTVTQVPLTITASNASKTYGSINPTLAITYSGFVGADDATSLTTQPTIATTAVIGSGVGTYPITVSGATSANYSISYVAGVLTVTPVILTITANDVSKLPGTTLTGGAGATAFTTSGLVNGETAGTVTINYGSGAAAADAPGVYSGQVTPSLLTGGNFIASNYTITYVNGNITVGAATISASGTLSALTTTFGTTSANGTFNVSGSGLSNNITVTGPAGFEVSTSANSAFAGSLTLTETGGTVNSTPVFIRLSATAAAGAYSGDVTLTSSGTTSVNVATVSSTINAAALTITANNVAKTYGQVITGGAASTAFVIGNGLKNGNTISSVTITYGSGSAAGDGAHTYSGSVIASSAVGANGFLAANYNITYVAGDITVNPAALTITATNASKVYGSANPALAATYSGFVGTDNAASLSVQPTISTTVLTTSAVGVYPITISGAAAANYTINTVAGILTVTPAALTITADNQSKTLGQINPTLTVTYAGFVNGDTPVSLTAAPLISTTANTNSAVGTYTITASGATDANYIISYVPGVLAIKAQANANLANLTVNIGALSPVFVQGTTAYSLAVANTITSVNVTATTVDPNAAIKINGSTVSSGVASGSLPLAVGSNVITTVVTAQDGFTKITYTVTITRAPSANANLSFLAISNATLSPMFGSAITAYTAGIANTINSVDITPTLADPTATITVNGTPAANGSAITIGALSAGDNTVKVVVTAQDGVTSLTYTVIIHRAAPPEAITATNILSPNGDGKNDNWIVKDILLYPNNTVTVYDRAGRTVFSKRNYTNDWGGTVNGSPLTEGTYYYVVDLGEPSSKTFTGFITILRNRR